MKRHLNLDFYATVAYLWQSVGEMGFKFDMKNWNRPLYNKEFYGECTHISYDPD